MSNSNPILERSLDEIIGEKKSERRNQPNRGGPARRGGKFNSRGGSNIQKPVRFNSRPPARQFNPNKSVPREISHMAGSRPLLRIKNVHRELTGQDLSQLFDSVAAVEFVKFDPSNDTIAYICFENNNAKNNSIAIGKYDGKKAMGREITVETTTSLADRIVLPARRDQPVKSRVNKPASSHPAKKSQARERPPKPAKKSLGDLDDELSAYMSGQAALPQEHTAPEPQSQEETPSAPVEANDEMALD